MPVTLRTVKEGDRLSAEQYNEIVRLVLQEMATDECFVDATGMHRRRGVQTASTQINIINTSSDLVIGNVLSPYQNYYDPTNAAQCNAYLETPTLLGRVPTSADRGNFCVLLQDCKANASARACIAGPCAVRLSGSTFSQNWLVDINPGSASGLVAYPGGAGRVLSCNNDSSGFGLVNLGSAPPFLLGQLTATLHAADTYAQWKWLNPDGSYGTSIGALNSLGLSGNNGSVVVAVYNQVLATNGSYPFVILATEQFLQNLINNVAFDGSTGILSQNVVQISTSGPGISSNSTLPSPNPATVTQTQDSGTDLQRDATTLSTPSLSPSSPSYGVLPTISATVSHSSGVANPTGYITFTVGSTILGTASINSSGVGTLSSSSGTWLNSLPDSGSIIAFYNGDSSYAQSTSSGTSYSLTTVTPTASLTVQESGSPSTNITTATYGDSLILTATISMPGGSTDTNAGCYGTVTFKNGTTTLGTTATSASTGGYVATLPLSNLPVGSLSLSAVFNPADTNQLNTVTGTASLTVNKLQLTVTTTNQAMVYGGSVPIGDGTPLGANFIITGWPTFPGFDTSITGKFALTCSGTSTSNIGTYSISGAIGTVASSSYTFNFVNTGQLTITAAPLTITANNVTVVHGANASPPAYTVTISGILNGDAISAVAGVVPAPDLTKPGSYVITINSITNPKPIDYSVTTNAGTLTVV